jgi:hypothetical protein
VEKIQTKESLEVGYERPDPWGYQTDQADAVRKDIILDTIYKYGRFRRALDVACGEAWITQELPAEEIWGYEISDNAASRFPSIVNRLSSLFEFNPSAFDLVLCTGALYGHYHWQALIDIINYSASQCIVTCNIADWEIPELRQAINAKQVQSFNFIYPRPEANYTQILRVFQK